MYSTPPPPPRPKQNLGHATPMDTSTYKANRLPTIILPPEVGDQNRILTVFSRAKPGLVDHIML